MDIGSGIISNAGISLGGMELATDYLYCDSELYEPELSEVKRDIYKKEDVVVHKTSEPVVKVNNDEIIQRFSIEIQQCIEDDIGKNSIDEEFSTDIWNTEEDKKTLSNSIGTDRSKTVVKVNNNETVEVKESAVIEHNSSTEKVTKREIRVDDDTGIDDIIKSAVQQKKKALKDNSKVKKVIREGNERNDEHRSRIERYNEMDISTLHKYVKSFLYKNDVSRGPVDITLVEKEFGADNIRLLISKCYIIKIGKGVTIGI